jgi:hypothetical protein
MTATCLHAGFLLGLFFHPEDEGDMFIRNVGWLSTDYTALCQRRYNSSWNYKYFIYFIPYLLKKLSVGLTEKFHMMNNSIQTFLKDGEKTSLPMLTGISLGHMSSLQSLVKPPYLFFRQMRLNWIRVNIVALIRLEISMNEWETNLNYQPKQ